MSAPVKLAAFALLLGAVFGAAVIAGDAADPDAPGGSGEDHSPGADAGHGSAHAAAPAPARGLSATADGLTLRLAARSHGRGRAAPLKFVIAGEDGEAVHDFDVAHEKRMHLIVVRRDLSGFQHLHPEMGHDGTWSVPLRIGEGGEYRVFADFTRDGRPYTLAADLSVPGQGAVRTLPAPADTAPAGGGLEVSLETPMVLAGEPADLRFAVSRGGEPVEVEPYLGAGGHLVVLREKDLAFLHVHPEGDGGHGEEIAFRAEFPSAGRYRMFLQVQHAGRVRTAAFTQEAMPR